MRTLMDLWQRKVTWHRSAALVPGTEPWCAFGIRDPSLLVDPHGSPIVTDGRVTLFFNARDQAGRTVVGRATSDDDGETWKIDHEPVISDGDYTAAGSVVRVDQERVIAFYSFDTTAGFRSAESRDGFAFSPGSSRPLLTPDAVSCSRIGLPYVTRVADGWVMVFEGFQRDARRFDVYGAFSNDLSQWEPMNGGAPLLGEHCAWNKHGRANPSLHFPEGTAGPAFLLYNGAPAHMEWDVGMARSDDLTRWVSSGNPLLRREPYEAWSAVRLEGARPFPSAQAFEGLLYFGTPTQDPYKNASIGYARIASLPGG